MPLLGSKGRRFKSAFHYYTAALILVLCQILFLVFAFNATEGTSFPFSFVPTLGRTQLSSRRDFAIVWPLKQELKCILYYAKISKCASSTMGGVIRRIGTEKKTPFKYEQFSGFGVDFWKSEPKVCSVIANHDPHPKDVPWLRKYRKNRNITMIAFIRKPMERALSEYFHFDVSRSHAGTGEASIIRGISQYSSTGKNKHLMSWWLDSTPVPIPYDKLVLYTHPGVPYILEQYDFIGLTERSDESLVVLKILFGLEFKDILHVGNSKSSENAPPKLRISERRVKAVKGPKVLEYIKSEEANVMNYPDQQLWNSVNKSLDLTIDAIGRSVFTEQLEKYVTLQKLLKEYCKGRENYPKVHGSWNDDCYWTDNGCGIKCMGDFVRSAKYANVVKKRPNQELHQSQTHSAETVLGVPTDLKRSDDIEMSTPAKARNINIKGRANFTLHNPTFAKSWPLNQKLKCILYYAKISKCASSTMGGVIRRIGTEKKTPFTYEQFSGFGVDFWKSEPKVCSVIANHDPHPKDVPWLRKYRENRNITMIAFIRKPMERALSEYFHFDVSRYHRGTGEASVIHGISQYSSTGKNKHLLSWWLDSTPVPIPYDKLVLYTHPGVPYILEQYDFIGLTERSDESLVVLKIIFGLDFKDILHVGNSKSSENAPPKLKVSERRVKPVKGPKVLEYIKSEEANVMNYPDQQLWNSVNKSLDLTIDAIGRSVFTEQLEKYVTLQKLLKDYCKGRENYPKVHGSWNDDCYWTDNGCGIKCMGDFVRSAKYANVVGTQSS